MEMEKTEVVTKETLLKAPSAVSPIIVCTGCCCCPCCGCDSCPSCDSCPKCCSCPSCCPPSCDCCCQLCCFLPHLLCQLPKLVGCPVNIKRFLIVLVVVGLVVLVVVGALLMGLHITQVHTEALLHMTIDELDGEESQLKFSVNKEEVATYYVDDGIHNPATIIYDFAKLLIGYKPEHQKACYITRMDKENVQGIDALLQEFQTKLSIMHLMPKGKEQAQEEEFLTSQVDRSNLGTTINVLCKHIPIFYT
ncbi:pulmonary surfactant-associated protein C-like [Protobothrops mucrosquamatus]|uniref:pulmonary surfactant-associated protein C-like n=1 Tax=Protobothrops mucrosquamatus TaxID=103944 RepID=UPI0010FB4B51|nr:pulmonary surfactant-associated protein C-like [Protobothrops mucrosquamatus]